MNSLIYQGEVSHARLAPVKHRFRYSVYFYAFDINELPELARQNPLFGYNQLRPVAIHDKDYLQANSLPLQQKLRQTLTEMGINEPQATFSPCLPIASRWRASCRSTTMAR